MTDLSTLLARVEAGSGADRETDCLVWAFAEDIEMEWQGTTLVAGEHGVVGWIDPDEYSRNFGCNRAASGPGSVPAYTTDLNAVIALVEARGVYEWSLVSARLVGGYYADVVAVNAVHGGAAPTPARALLAALLRAEMEKQT